MKFWNKVAMILFSIGIVIVLAERFTIISIRNDFVNIVYLVTFFGAIVSGVISLSLGRLEEVRTMKTQIALYEGYLIKHNLESEYQFWAEEQELIVG